MRAVDRNKGLAIVGAYPPPFGGVTVHIHRLARLLEEEGIDFTVYNLSSGANDPPRVHSVADRRLHWLAHHLFVDRRHRASYIVNPRLETWIGASAARSMRHRPIGIRLQNNRLVDWVANDDPRAVLAGLALRRVDLVICVNQELATAVRSLGVPADRVHRMPGFLVPDWSREEDRPMSGRLDAFLSAHRPVLLINGKVAWLNGEDLYGFDLTVELLGRLIEHPKAGLVVLFTSIEPGHDERVRELRARAGALGIGGRLFFNEDVIQLTPVLRRSDVFLRPTRTDGDANSLREALCFGIPSVASDIVRRPEGTRLFACGDLASYVEATREALAAERPAEPPGPSPEDRARARTYISLLRRLVDGGASS